MELGLLVLRAVVGLLFAGHGAQKLFGSFGGHGPDGTGGFFETLGLKPGRPMALAAGVSEFAGGLLLALGLLTPLAAVMLIGTMVTAIASVHYVKGLWSTNGGYEYNLVLIAAVFAITAIGPGAWSLDSALKLDLAGDGWAIAALVLAIIGGLGAVAVGRQGRAERRTHDARPTAA